MIFRRPAAVDALLHAAGNRCMPAAPLRRTTVLQPHAGHTTGGHWMPAEPYKPIGLVCAAIGWHKRNNSLDHRPAAVELAMGQERPRRDEEERRQFRAEMEAARVARREAQNRLGKPAHRAAQQVAAEIGARAARKRAADEEAEHQARAELVARVRGQR